MVKLHIIALSLLATISSFSFANILTIEPYRDAQLVKSLSQAEEWVSVPLGRIGRSGRGWEPESVIRVQGDYLTSLHKIDRSADISTIVAHYRAQMLTKNRTILFECESRSCGSSNAWANDFFNDYLLNGADQNQYLLVVKGQQELYQMLYINRRGAGDVMVRIDEVKSADSYGTEFSIVAQLDALDIPGIRRFVRDLPTGESVIGFVTSKKTATKNAVDSGDQLIQQIQAGLGEQLKDNVRFINVADLGVESLGVNRISFVYATQ